MAVVVGSSQHPGRNFIYAKQHVNPAAWVASFTLYHGTIAENLAYFSTIRSGLNEKGYYDQNGNFAPTLLNKISKQTPKSSQDKLLLPFIELVRNNILLVFVNNLKKKTY